MRVSYVVTFYNKERFVPFVLASLAAQSGPFEREFIFIDDGSTDRTLSVLREGTRGWPAVKILTQTNAGPSSALNRGIAAASGDAIKPIDGDDVIAPHATASLLQILIKTGVDAAFFPAPSFYDPGSDTPSQVLARFPTDVGSFRVNAHPMRRSIRGPTVNPSGWIARRALLDRAGLCDEAVFTQDYSIELRIAWKSAVAEIDDSFVAFPIAGPGRVSDNQAQILHDINLATIRFLRATPQLPWLHRYTALRRAAKRSLAWEQRHGKHSILPRLRWLHLRSVAGLLEPTQEAEHSLCEPFRTSGRVRLISNA